MAQNGRNGETRMPDVSHVVGVDIGGTKIRAALATSTGEVLSEAVIATDKRGGMEIVHQIADLVHRLGLGSRQEIAATCIAGPGTPNRRNGSFDLAPNIRGLDSIDMVEELAKSFGHSPVIENDVNAAVIGEWRHGHGVGARDFAFISLGTGIGMGLVANDQLVKGAHDAAGEIGYLPLGDDPYDTGNQRRGPLEEATAGRAVALRYLSSTGHSLTTPEIFELSMEGDIAAFDAINTHAKYVAEAVLSIVAIVDPSFIVLGGGIGARPNVADMVRKWLRELGKPHIDMRTSVLGERTSVIGAIQIATDHADLERVGGGG